MPGGRVLVALVAGALAAPGSAHAITPSTVRASVTSTGAEINGTSLMPAVSADGRWVAFQSDADFLPGDGNGLTDVFLRDMHTGQVRRISQKADGSDADGSSTEPAISADGRVVAFLSQARNLAGGATDANRDVYVYDRITGTLRRVTTSTTGDDGDGESFELSMSPDGTALSFTSAATDLVPGGDANGYRDIYVADVAGLKLTRVSRRADGSATSIHSGGSDVSDGGRFVSFNSDDALIVAGDANMSNDVFVRDMQTGVTTRQSVTSNGGEANNASVWTAITGDGCWIAFNSLATNLVPFAPSGYKVYVRNRCAPSTEIASISDGGTMATVEPYQPAISDDGCAIAFASSDAALSTTGLAGAFLRERCAGGTQRMDLSTNSDIGNGTTQRVRLSATGRYVTFDSGSYNLVLNDGNSSFDAFVRDRAIAKPPVADLQVAVAGRRVTVDGGGSRDPDNGIASATISFGDGSPEATGLTAVHDYARDGSFTITLAVRDRDDLTTVATKAVTVTAPPDTVPPGGGTVVDVPGPGSTTLPPLPPAKLELTGGVLSRTRFAVVPKGRRVGGRRGATLLLGVSERATLELVVERARKGRKVRGRCRSGARRGSRCTLYRRVGGSKTTLLRGDNTVALTGRVAGKALAPGRYRLRATARTADGRTSATLTRSFTIVKR